MINPEVYPRRLAFFKYLTIVLMVLVAINGDQTRSVASARQNDLLAKELQQALDKKVRELEVPGLQASVRVGDYHWSGNSGSIDFSDDVELSNDHIFRIGSVTKTFTAALILKLYEQGEINLDDKLSKWFPEYPQSEAITIRHLLNHSSGIYNYTENLWLAAQTFIFPKKKWEPLALFKSTYNKKFYFPPGKGHYYSNTNYLILGLIIEKITGRSMLEVFREEIFTPLKLNNTYYVPYEQAPDRLITGYDRDILPFGDHQLTPEQTSFATLAYSAGAIVSTANDLRKWIDALFSSDFLQETTINEMMNYLEAKDPDVPCQIGYGLGLRVLNIDSDLIYGHTGTIPGFGAAVFYCPSKNYSLAIVSNISMFDQVSVLEELIPKINNLFLNL